MAGLNLTSLHELSNRVCDNEELHEQLFTLTKQDWFNFTEFNFPGHISDRSLTWLDQAKIGLYLCTFVVALFGNLVVLLAVLRYRALRGPINLYLANLAVADLLICLCCMWVHLVNNITAPAYILGPFFCKINGFVQMTCLTSSVLTLSAISCDRYIAIMYPLRSRVTKQRTDAVIAAIWIFSLFISTPFLMYRRLQTLQWSNYTETTCLEVWPSRSSVSADSGLCVQQHLFKRIYYTLVSSTLFFVPVLTMLTAYSAIIWRLTHSQCPASASLSGQLSALRHRAKRKITKMSIAILVVFVLCWLPLQMTVLYSIYLHSSHSDGVLPSWFSSVSFVSTYLAYSNSVFNPLIYGRFSRRFRHACQSIVRSSLQCHCCARLGLELCRARALFKPFSSTATNASNANATTRTDATTATVTTTTTTAITTTATLVRTTDRQQTVEEVVEEEEEEDDDDDDDDEDGVEEAFASSGSSSSNTATPLNRRRTEPQRLHLRATGRYVATASLAPTVEPTTTGANFKQVVPEHECHCTLNGFSASLVEPCDGHSPPTSIVSLSLTTVGESQSQSPSQSLQSLHRTEPNRVPQT